MNPLHNESAAKFSCVVSKISNGLEPTHVLGCPHSSTSPLLEGASVGGKKVTLMYTDYHFDICVLYSSDE